jgi:hypothetical protein
MRGAAIRRQLRLVPALLVPTVRAVGWGPPLAAFTVSLGLLALAVRPGLTLPADLLVRWLRITMTVGALGYAFLLDDPGELTTEGVAGSLLLRRTVRVALLLPVTTAWWVAALWRVQALHPEVPLPVAALTLETVALLAVTVALAAAGSRLAPERRGGVVAAPALLAVVSAALLLPPGSRCTPSGPAPPGPAPTNAGPCCWQSRWQPSPPPAATPPTAAFPPGSAISPIGFPAAGQRRHPTPRYSTRSRPRPSPLEECQGGRVDVVITHIQKEAMLYQVAPDLDYRPILPRTSSPLPARSSFRPLQASIWRHPGAPA